MRKVKGNDKMQTTLTLSYTFNALPVQNNIVAF